jgi:hypothetical protein
MNEARPDRRPVGSETAPRVLNPLHPRSDGLWRSRPSPIGLPRQNLVPTPTGWPR